MAGPGTVARDEGKERGVAALDMVACWSGSRGLFKLPYTITATCGRLGQNYSAAMDARVINGQSVFLILGRGLFKMRSTNF